MHPSQFLSSIETLEPVKDTESQAKLTTTLRNEIGDRWERSPLLTVIPPLLTCRVSVVIPVQNEADNLPAVLEALAHQVDGECRQIDPDIYEILVLANNCTDKTVEVVKTLSDRHPFLRLHVIDVTLPREAAFVGKARQMVMDEACRRFSLIGLSNRIIASTDGDTEVASNWIYSLLCEFDKGVDAVGGRILARRADEPDISAKVSLYYLRRVAHAYLSSQISCLIDPQLHDGWPRHFQFCGANMAVSAQMYARVDGMPLVRDEEDVALYQRLQKADAKIRHSLDVRVTTSARQTGRATSGLSELLTALSYGEKQDALVESPVLTEARIVVRRYLWQVWAVLRGDRHNPLDSSAYNFTVKDYAKTAELLARSLGVPVFELRSQLESAVTFGELVTALFTQQLEHLAPSLFATTTEISSANQHLRQRLSDVRKCAVDPVEKLVAASEPLQLGPSSRVVLEALQQVQAIPLFPPAY